jgi:hypothetical protein
LGRVTIIHSISYRYAIILPCDWIIVTSMRETRLYHKGSQQHAYERFETVRLAADPDEKPIWQNFRGLFHAIDEGNAGLNIPAYNGGLFAADPAMDALQVPDQVCGHFKDVGDYDYRPAREKADADESTVIRAVIEMDILGTSSSNP